MKQVYRPFWLWEDYKEGMYQSIDNYSEKKQELLSKRAKEFLSNEKLFFKTGVKMVEDWKFSAEHNLTNTSLNRLAWIGQASCFYYLKIPELITKYGWRLMSAEKQKQANKVAGKILNSWRDKYDKEKNKQKRL